MAVSITAERDSVAVPSLSMATAPSIASITVVYDGAQVLRRHLDALKNQTHPIDEIIVVNNASTDDTANLLAKHYPEITVLNLPTNGGVGAGLAAGLEYAALKKRYDWIWLFDQDCVPSSNGLAGLLSGLTHLAGSADRTAILAPLCVHPETKMTFPGRSWSGGRFVSTPGNPNEPITLVDSVITSGSLMRREAIEEAGLPRADFFMDFVDHEHCLRLRRHGFKIAVVRESILHHALGDPSKFRILGWTKYWTDHVPWREYYMTRNEIFTIWQYYPGWKIKAFTLYRLARHAAVLMLFGKRKLLCLRMMWRGLRDGWTSRLGIRFGGEEK